MTSLSPEIYEQQQKANYQLYFASPPPHHYIHIDNTQLWKGNKTTHFQKWEEGEKYSSQQKEFKNLSGRNCENVSTAQAIVFHGPYLQP